MSPLLAVAAPAGLICRLQWKDPEREYGYAERTASVIGWDEDGDPWVMHPVVGLLMPAFEWITQSWPEHLGNDDERWVRFIRESDDGVRVEIA